jgi:hypothetical protein
MIAARVYLGRDACRLAAVLIAYGGNDVCERVATWRVKMLAFRASPETAAQLMLWSAVLSRSRMELAPGEAVRIIAATPESELRKLAAYDRRSRPQAVPARREPVSQVG